MISTLCCSLQVFAFQSYRLDRLFYHLSLCNIDGNISKIIILVILTILASLRQVLV